MRQIIAATVTLFVAETSIAFLHGTCFCFAPMRRFFLMDRHIFCCRNFYCISAWRLLLFRPYAAIFFIVRSIVCCRNFYGISAWRMLLFRPYAAIFFSDRSIVCCRNFYCISAWRLLLFRPYAAIFFIVRSIVCISCRCRMDMGRFFRLLVMFFLQLCFRPGNVCSLRCLRLVFLLHHH